MADDPRGPGGAGPDRSDSPAPADPGDVAPEATPGRAPYEIDALSYGWRVQWELNGAQIALVILEDEGVYRCCFCRRSTCAHAAAVREHVMGDHSARKEDS